MTPKFVFGGKKYGRRSRPTSTDQDEDKENICCSPTEDGDTFAMVGKRQNVELAFISIIKSRKVRDS